MRNLTSKEKNWLKIFHLLFVAAWLGGQMCLITLQITKNQLALPEHQAAILTSLKTIDDMVIVGGAMGCLFTGLIFSLSTPWGFFKFRWIAVKWVLTILLILFGILFLGPWINEMAALAMLGSTGAAAKERFLQVENLSTLFGNFQFITGIFLLAISVLKPWKKKTSTDSSKLLSRVK